MMLLCIWQENQNRQTLSADFSKVGFPNGLHSTVITNEWISNLFDFFEMSSNSLQSV